MAVLAPILISPSVSTDYFTDRLDHFISGTVESDVVSVKYKYFVAQDDTTVPVYSALSILGVTITETEDSNVTTLPWSFRTSKLAESLVVGSRLYLQFFAFTDTEQSTESEIKVSFIDEGSITASVSTPTGVSLERFNTHLRVLSEEVLVSEDSTSQIVGYNFYVSTEPGGGALGYKIMNQDTINEVSSVRKDSTILSDEENETGGILVNTIISNVVDINLFSFDFDKVVFTRMVSSGDLPNIVYNEDSRFFFTITAVAYDSLLGQVVESGFSVELEGRFLTFSTNVISLPRRTRPDILLSITKKVISANNKINVVSSSVIRDLLDPISDEFSRYYTVQDFVFKAISINSLLAFDDADGDGVSDPVASSSEKTKLQAALNLRDSFIVQTLIDEQFDKLAANYNLSRKSATKAVGTVTFFSNDVPVDGLEVKDGAIVSTSGDISQGISPVSFSVKGGNSVRYEDREFFFNEETSRYEITSSIEADVAGVIGNVPSGLVTIINSGVSSNFRVENQVSTSFGTERETNLDIANRIKLASVSLDTGTEGGYAASAVSVKGVQEVRVEKVGDPLMMRDMFEGTSDHIGGKVDIYVQGKRPKQVTDRVAFKFGSTLDINGTQVGEVFDVEDATSLRIRSKNPRVTASTPIFEVTRVVNVTKNKEYDLSGLAIVGDGDTIDLADNTTNLTVGMSTLDIVEVDYKYRSSNTFVLENQPVLGIVSIEGDIDGILSPSNYRLIKLEDPVLTGGSNISNDGVEILYVNGVPSDGFNTISGEEHTLILSTPVDLFNKGVDINSIVMKDISSTVTYIRDLDYSINLGNQVQATQVSLVPNGKIRNGQKVKMSYRASQNFTIVYTTNELVSLVYEKVKSTKHACADVIVKQSIENKVDISLSVIRKKNTSEETVMSQIRTVISNHVSSLKQGSVLNQSKIISLIERLPNVRKVIVPFQKMMKRNGSFIPMDSLGTLSFKIFNTNIGKGITAYITNRSVLTYRTSTNGGSSNLFRAIYEDGRHIVLVDSPADVSSSFGRGYIQADGKLVVSTRDGSPPQTKKYSASYYTFYNSGQDVAQDILTSSIEYLSIDENSLVIDASVEEQFTSRGI